MTNGRATRRLHRLTMHLGDHLIQPFGDSDLAMVQSAVALLRTVFEDHYVDPDHNSCLFFHGCTLVGSRARSHDFSVVHRGDRVVLSDFTFAHEGPDLVSLSLWHYALEVTRFGASVLNLITEDQNGPDWQQRYLESQRDTLQQLVALARRFISDGCQDYELYCQEFQALQGHLKRPLELQVLTVLERGAPRQPVRILGRILYGPLRLNEVVPMRLNLGDVVLVSVIQFTNEGVDLRIEGVGSGGLRAGDRLYGLQMFYP